MDKWYNLYNAFYNAAFRLWKEKISKLINSYLLPFKSSVYADFTLLVDGITNHKPMAFEYSYF